MTESTLIGILGQFFFVGFIVGTILLVVRAIKNYSLIPKIEELPPLQNLQNQSAERKTTKRRVLTKSAIALSLWFLFSVYIFALDLINSVGHRAGPEPLAAADSRILGIIGAHILWVLAGMLLIYWIGRPPKPSSLS